MNVAVRPLLARRGARYTCFGDGVCCSDVHALGALTRSEVKRLELIQPGVTKRNAEIDAMVMKTAHGGCVMLGDKGCRIHEERGADQKPSVCRRFPYRLVDTPLGGRIATEQRCPCRTMGARPPLDVEDARVSLSDAAGRLSSDLKVGATIRLDGSRRISFEKYAQMEATMIDRLLAGEDPLAVFDAAPFPPLEGVKWTDVAHLFRSRIDGSACGDALAWFGDNVLRLESEGAELRVRQRPWQAAFERASARSPTQATQGEVFADWLADELWSLEWTDRGTFAQARHDFATRLAVARVVVEVLGARGVREDQAAAEGVLVAEMGGAAPLWRSVVAAFEVSPASGR